MTRAVFDANALVSMFPTTSGTLASLFNRWRAGQFRLVVSEPVLAEVARAWTNPYWQARISPDLVERTLTLLRRDADVTALTVMIAGVATHAEDDLILAAAISGQVDYIVTGDRQLQRLDSYQGVNILSPRQFLTLLEHEDTARPE